MKSSTLNRTLFEFAAAIWEKGLFHFFRTHFQFCIACEQAHLGAQARIKAKAHAAYESRGEAARRESELTFLAPLHQTPP